MSHTGNYEPKKYCMYCTYCSIIARKKGYVRECRFVIKWVDTPMCKEPIYGDLNELNKNNDCKYFLKYRPDNAHPKRKWWQFWK